MKLGKQVGPGRIVLGGDPAPSRKDTASQFSAHVRCGHTAAAWIKMPLRMEVGLVPGNSVLEKKNVFEMTYLVSSVTYNLNSGVRKLSEHGQ